MSKSTFGSIEGFNVTNSFHGNYEINQRGGILINSIIWTEKDEPKWGYLFHTIVKEENYEIRGGQLIIFHNQKKNSITLQKN